MEISKDDSKDSELDENSESDACSESRENAGPDNEEPDLEETTKP